MRLMLGFQWLVTSGTLEMSWKLWPAHFKCQSVDVYRRSSNSLKVNEGEEVALSLPPQKWFLDFRVTFQRQPTVWFVTRPQTRKYGKPKWLDIENQALFQVFWSALISSGQKLFLLSCEIFEFGRPKWSSLCSASSHRFWIWSERSQIWGWNCKELCAPAMGRRPSAQDLHELMNQKIESLEFI